jgi:hypothetical protein
MKASVKLLYDLILMHNSKLYVSWKLNITIDWSIFTLLRNFRMNCCKYLIKFRKERLNVQLI